MKIDDSNEKLGYKIRAGQMQKIPYLLVLGDKEMKQHTVNVRKYGEEKSKELSLNVWKEIIEKQIKERSLSTLNG